MLYSWNPFLVVLALLGMAFTIYAVRGDRDHLFALSISLSFLLLPQTPIWGLALLLVPMNILWSRATRLPILLIWLAGWLSIIGNFLSSSWWMLQVILFPIAVLLVVLYAHMIPSDQEHARIRTP